MRTNRTLYDLILKILENKLKGHKPGLDVIDNLPMALATLSENERDIIELRYSSHPLQYTYRELGDMRGVGQNIIRQIEARALRKLREPDRLKILLENTTLYKVVFPL